MGNVALGANWLQTWPEWSRTDYGPLLSPAPITRIPNPAFPDMTYPGDAPVLAEQATDLLNIPVPIGPVPTEEAQTESSVPVATQTGGWRGFLDKVFGAPPRPAPGQAVINAVPPTPSEGYANLKANLSKLPVVRDIGDALDKAGTVGKWVVAGAVAVAVVVIVVQVKRAFA